MQGEEGIPQVYWFGKESSHYVLVMELLERNLETIFSQEAQRKNFSLMTIILIVDKVLFDTHALWEDAAGGHAHGDHHDPADKRLEKNLKASMSKSQQLANQGDVKASRIEQKEGTEGAMKSYLNPHDRFAERMRASMSKKSDAEVDDDAAAQQHLFVDGANVDLKQ